jgi:beta-lactamase superfamily II metal-dependent hydrolase
MERILASGSKILRTDNDGTITFKVNEAGLARK